LRIAPFALAALLSVPAAARGAEHPRLLYRTADVATLRAQAGSTHAVIRGSLKAGTDEFLGSRISSSGVVTWPGGRTFSLGDRRDIGYALMVWAFTWQLEGSQPHLDLAKAWLNDLASWSSWDLDGEHDLVQAHLLFGAAFAYDVLHPQLTEAQRTAVRNGIVREASSLMTFGKNGGWWQDDVLQNHNWINHAAVGFAALAVEGEVPQAQVDAWLAYATSNARRIQRMCGVLGDGTWHEGFGYLSYGFTWHLPFVEALKRSGREDLTDLRLLRGLGAARAHAQLPEQPHAYVLANGDFIGFHLDDQLAALRYAASRYGSGLAQLAADRWVAGTPRFTYGPESAQQILEYLFHDPAVPAADLAAEPLDWYGGDLQAVVFRSGWEKGSLLFAMKSGPYGGVTAAGEVQAGNPDFPRINFAHDHADDNGFYLYGGGAWLAPEASGYYIGHADSPGPQANKTVFHNSLLVNGQGQLGEGVRASSDASSSYAWFFQRQGGIPLQASTAHHAYAVAEGAKLYPPAMGLTRFDRHALFLDRRVVVLRDVVSATSAKDFDWLVHVMDGATREGSWLKGAAKSGQVLGVAVVSPAAFSVTTTPQSPAKIDKLDPDGSVTAVLVRPSTPAAEVTFLTALVPTTAAGWASRPQVRALDVAQPSAGLEVVEGARVSRAIFNDLPAGVRDAGGLKLAGLAGAVSLQDGEPTRALLVQGRSLAAGGRTLLAVEGASDALEADGLGGDVIALTGQLEGQATVWAPRATRAFVNGREVPLRRAGETVEVGGATAAEPALGGDQGTAPSAPALGGGAATDPVPAAPAAPPLAQEPAAPGVGSGVGSGGDTIGPGTSPVELAQGGGCSLGGGETGVLALLGVVALTARAVRRARRRQLEPAPAAEPERPADEREAA
jgi:hypothetical protein